MKSLTSVLIVFVVFGALVAITGIANPTEIGLKTSNSYFSTVVGLVGLVCIFGLGVNVAKKSKAHAGVVAGITMTLIGIMVMATQGQNTAVAMFSSEQLETMYTITIGLCCMGPIVSLISIVAITGAK